MRCKSAGPGSVIWLSRCMRMPICRCSRTAYWAAAIERCRPTVIGKTMPGNKVRSRTGMMAIASGGNSATGADPLAPALGASRDSTLSTGRLRLLEHNYETAIDAGTANVDVAAGWKAQSSLELSLWKLEPMYDGPAEFRRQRARPG